MQYHYDVVILFDYGCDLVKAAPAVAAVVIEELDDGDIAFGIARDRRRGASQNIVGVFLQGGLGP